LDIPRWRKILDRVAGKPKTLRPNGVEDPHADAAEAHSMHRTRSIRDAEAKAAAKAAKNASFNLRDAMRSIGITHAPDYTNFELIPGYGLFSERLAKVRGITVEELRALMYEEDNSSPLLPVSVTAPKNAPPEDDFMNAFGEGIDPLDTDAFEPVGDGTFIPEDAPTLRFNAATGEFEPLKEDGLSFADTDEVVTVGEEIPPAHPEEWE